MFTLSTIDDHLRATRTMEQTRPWKKDHLSHMDFVSCKLPLLVTEGRSCPPY